MLRLICFHRVVPVHLLFPHDCNAAMTFLNDWDAFVLSTLFVQHSHKADMTALRFYKTLCLTQALLSPQQEFHCKWQSHVQYQ